MAGWWTLSTTAAITPKVAAEAWPLPIPENGKKWIKEWPGYKDTRAKVISWGISPNMLIGFKGLSKGTDRACAPYMLLPFMNWSVHLQGGCYPLTATGGLDSCDAPSDGYGLNLGVSHQMRRPSGAEHQETSDLGNIPNMLRPWLAYEEMMYIKSKFLDNG